MALLQFNFESAYLFGNTNVNIILPDLPRNKTPQEFYESGKKYPVLWLLHGTFGDASDWLRKSNIELYACEKNLIVVMPSAMNSDYTNWPGFGMGYKMYDYLTEELMPLVYNWFPASDKREDNFIAGLSMGGLGACVYAFNHPEKFSAAYVMSSCPRDMREPSKNSPWAYRTENQLKNAGGLKEFLESPQNVWDLTKKLAHSSYLPKLYFACGTEDTLMYENFKKFLTYAQEVGLEAEFEEISGYSHEWRFWELCIQKAVNVFLPDKHGEGNLF